MGYDVPYEIKRHIGILSKNKSGWRKELTLTSWNHEQPKLDIRNWNEDYTKHNKQGTFTDEEMRTLKDILNKLDI
ncbi:PC4/YdbC family ssDNA-binding protein [Ihubacter massiliensis]|uniref:YdbC family protein n=1 Tax=Ihubacter massiliensis TaxID=1852367 RepID=UPI002096CF81|nr:PC4/YdbC family ssDNA-binding protein [Ihubacter massiliensis]MCI7301307.1 PC4/YdbC family ssDNA-binding protein [Clostridia bacterium]MCO7120579.1 PC4/YdbC family ssDNA-binding protein [Ihubacter massiliensis]MDY3010613.1 PC4/YdbC family ssDNA-binding protein [Clostridiales Family XIII bacterium]